MKVHSDIVSGNAGPDNVALRSVPLTGAALT